MRNFTFLLLLLLASCSPKGNFKHGFFQANFQNGELNKDRIADFDPAYLYIKLLDVDYVEANSQAIPKEKLQQYAIDTSSYKLVAGIRVGAETFRHKGEQDDFFEYLAHRAFGQMTKIWQRMKLGDIKRIYIQCDWTPETEADVTMFCDTFTQFCTKLGIEVSIFMPKYYASQLNQAYSIHPDRWVIAYGAGTEQAKNGVEVTGAFPDANFCKQVIADGAAVDVLFMGNKNDLKNAYDLPLPDARMIFYEYSPTNPDNHSLDKL